MQNNLFDVTAESLQILKMVHLIRPAKPLSLFKLNLYRDPIKMHPFCFWISFQKMIDKNEKLLNNNNK